MYTSINVFSYKIYFDIAIINEINLKQYENKMP